MERIINSEGLFHIAKKILAYIDYKFVWKCESEIKSLRLTCKSWNSIIDRYELCKMWQMISRKRAFFSNGEKLSFLSKLFDEELSILHSDLYEKAIEINDEKLIKDFSNGLQSQSRFEISFWRSYLHYRHITLSDIKPTPLEDLICNGPYELLSDLWKHFDFYLTRRGTFSSFLKIATFNYCRSDLVELLCQKFSDCVQNLSEEFILSVIKVIITCDESTVNVADTVIVKKALIDILNTIMNNPINNQCLAINPGTYYDTEPDKFYLETHPLDWFRFQMEWIPRDGIKNPFIMALHMDKYYKHLKLVRPFIKHFKKVKYPQEIGFDVLKLINLYAILRGYPEIASIVAEKLGSDIYIIFIKEIMTDCPYWATNQVKKIVKSILIIDNELFESIGSYAKKTILDNKIGEELLEEDALVIDSVKDSFVLTEKTMAKNVLQSKSDRLQNEICSQVDSEEDFYFEDSENEEADLYESESDVDENED